MASSEVVRERGFRLITSPLLLVADVDGGGATEVATGVVVEEGVVVLSRCRRSVMDSIFSLYWELARARKEEERFSQEVRNDIRGQDGHLRSL